MKYRILCQPLDAANPDARPFVAGGVYTCPKEVEADVERLNRLARVPSYPRNNHQIFAVIVG